MVLGIRLEERPSPHRADLRVEKIDQNKLITEWPVVLGGKWKDGQGRKGNKSWADSPKDAFTGLLVLPRRV